MLECLELDYFYKTVQPLKKVSFSVKCGELIALFGHNGAGKTTLLKLLGGSLPLCRGAYKFSGTSLTDKQGFLKASMRSQFGLLFQSTSSDEKLSAYHNLRYSALLMGVAKATIEKVVDDVLIFADLKERAHEPIKKFSGGMRRRLELYRTFLHEPKIVLLDEPTAGLDVYETQKFFSFLKAYQARTGAIVIMANHRAEEVSKCDRVIMLKDGMLIADGNPGRLIANLQYLRCSFKIDEQRETQHSLLFGLSHNKEDGMTRAKFPSSSLDELLKSSFLREKNLESFSIEKPTIADAYEDLLK